MCIRDSKETPDDTITETKLQLITMLDSERAFRLCLSSVACVTLNMLTWCTNVAQQSAGTRARRGTSSPTTVDEREAITIVKMRDQGFTITQIIARPLRPQLDTIKLRSTVTFTNPKSNPMDILTHCSQIDRLHAFIPICRVSIS